MRELDSFNTAIMQHAQADDRMSIVDLAKNVGLSTSDCLLRVQDMERHGLLKDYHPNFDQKTLSKDLTIFVMVGLSRHLKKDALAFEAAMNNALEVQECHNITGNVEYMLRVQVADLSAYKLFHTDRLGALPMVRSITSHIALSTSKNLSREALDQVSFEARCLGTSTVKRAPTISPPPFTRFSA